MTNSREMAEQAFALLQSALEESESKRASLERQLETNPLPASEQEIALEDLRRELDQAREERDLWKQTSGQLQDVASNERSKAKRLAERIRIIESGSDRVSRKEMNFWRSKAEDFEIARREFQQRLLELRKQLDERDERDELAEAARAQNEELERIRSLLEERDARIAEFSARLEGNRLEREDFEQRIAHLDTEVRSLSQQVIDAESARNEACRSADNIDAELKDLRAESATNQRRLEELQHSVEQQVTLGNQYKQRIDELETQHDREIEALREEHLKEAEGARQTFEEQLYALRTQHAEQIERRDSELTAAGEAHAAALSEARAEASAETQQQHEQQLEELTQQLESRAGQLADLEQQLESRAGQLADLEQQLESRAGRLADLEKQLESRAGHVADLEQQLDDHVASGESLRTERDNVAAQLVALEAQLASERERSDNLNEIANEHREALSKTTERLEEMEERYEDAKWRLGKAQHFDKLVRRRRKLVEKLIRNIRAKDKANNALKAGLDSLRRYKANSDERQQELLRRIEILENSLSEAKEKLIQTNQARRSTDAAPVAAEVEAGAEVADSSALSEQVAAQAEAIENLEAELRSARVTESEAQARLEEVDRLHEDLATKNAFIDTLQKDIEEKQEVVGQLRKREIEVRDLNNRIEELESAVDALQSENSRLRPAKSTDDESDDQQLLVEKEEMIQKLTAKLQEYESSITTLSEAADSWKRRYDFLASDDSFDSKSASSK